MRKKYHLLIVNLLSFICAFIFAINMSKAVTTISDIASRLFDMEGQIVEVDIRRAYNPHQTSAEEYEFNISSGDVVAIVIVPAEKGVRWFPNGKISPVAPPYIMTKVSHGRIQNQYGASREGPLLYWVDK